MLFSSARLSSRTLPGLPVGKDEEVSAWGLVLRLEVRPCPVLHVVHKNRLKHEGVGSSTVLHPVDIPGVRIRGIKLVPKASGIIGLLLAFLAGGLGGSAPQDHGGEYLRFLKNLMKITKNIFLE